MSREIDTIRELVDSLGGTSAVAKWAAMNQSAISNWIERNHVPPSWHMDLVVEVRKRGLPPINPKVFGLVGEAADLHRDLFGLRDGKPRPNLEAVA